MACGEALRFHPPVVISSNKHRWPGIQDSFTFDAKQTEMMPRTFSVARNLILFSHANTHLSSRNVRRSHRFPALRRCPAPSESAVKSIARARPNLRPGPST
eukprot:scaffold54043_cov41-Prasinocladus_malaysianus.AAC.1